MGYGASLLKVFWPYLDWNTVFDNSRVVAGTGRSAGEVLDLRLSASAIQPREQVSSIRRSRGLRMPQRCGRKSQRRERRRMTDFLLVAWVSALIELRRLGWMFGLGKRWTPGEKLKLLFAGYNGTRNTGSDVRVQEMLRQIRHVLGAENVDFSVMTQNFDRTKGYFEGTRQVHLPDVFPPFLFREVRQNHGVIACEGSMFKSKFANALTTMMIGSLGLASAENKLSRRLRRRSRAHGRADSNDVRALRPRFAGHHAQPGIADAAQRTGDSNELGTDTAWTFEPHPPEYGRKVLARSGLGREDSRPRVVPDSSVCLAGESFHREILARATTGAYKDSQYRTVYFFESGAEVDRKFQHYIAGYTNAAKAFVQKHRVFPILVAMERLDAVACREIAEEMPGIADFHFRRLRHVSARLDSARMLLHGFVALSRHCHLHAGRVASAGVTMDERIRNLMRERGHQHLLLTVDDPDLEPKLLQDDGNAGRGSGCGARRHRQDRGRQSESAWRAWVRFSGRRCAPHVSRISAALRVSCLGRLSAAD